MTSSIRREIARLKERARRSSSQPEIDLEEHIADCYKPLHADILAGRHQFYNLPGGRGSCKSSFVSLELVDQVMRDQTGETNAIVFRRIAATMRDSVFAQVGWAIGELGVSHLWRGMVSPMQWEYLPTGALILFRGLDDASKLKSIKPRKGSFRLAWFEEFAELPDEKTQRSVLQSVVRGGGRFAVFRSFNPPMSANNWANRLLLQPDPRSVTLRTDYTMVPPEWLGEQFLQEAETLRTVNERAYLHEYMGEATGTGGEVFPNIEAREITDEEIAGFDYCFNGLDWGFSVDPLAFVHVSYDARTRTLCILDEIYKRGMSNEQAAEAIKAKPYYRTEYHTGFTTRAIVTCDSAEPKSIADLRGQDINAIPCQKWPGSVLYGVKWLQAQRIIIDPARTPNAYREFTGYEYAQTRDGEFTADVPDRDNHTIDAVRYACDRLIRDRRNSA